MWRYVLEKNWTQNLILIFFGLIMVYYWGFVFDFGYKFDWSVLYTVNETYGENLGFYLIKGLKLTVEISLWSSAFALLLGVVFGLGRLSSFKPYYYFSTVYVEFFRNTPLLVQLFFWYFALPQGLPESWRQFLFSQNYEFLSATLGLSIYTGAFMAEIIRAGIQSIPKGLLEAAYSSGLSYFQILRKIILPLAFRAIIPPLGSEFLNNMKNSSLAMVVGVPELCWQSQQIESLTFRGFEATTAATFIYLSLSLTISGILNLINAKLQIIPKEKRTWQHKLAYTIFSPFDFIFQLLNWIGQLFSSKKNRLSPQASKTKLELLWYNLWLWTKKITSFCLKTVFILALSFLLYKAIMGIFHLNWTIIEKNIRYLLIWRFPSNEPGDFFWGLGGLAFSILMAVIAISVSFFIGLIVGIARTSKYRLFRIPALLYIELIRGNPLIMVIFWVYFFVPIFTKVYINVFWSATIALTIFTGAYLAEIVRGGIQNLPLGQFEAAYSTGLNYFQTMRKIVLPQALKQMIPAIVGQFIAIFKDTSLAYVIGVLELTFVAQSLNNRLMIYPFEIYTTVAFLYFICCYLMSIVAAKLENRLKTDTFRLQM
ncbi:polar amino acid transport system permease protein [Desulfonauticus submarinus]|uniref:Polar amino acid transport system permease protein n=1 Tax=Desulfonauticus submarinus TaxID=206665 RepID=A0A1H0D480_9BACT|nr:amino acid ABC transporter permease [Desulfonauticus submarinus]SDN64896.1 polar amino acid transport system permease protein [Desulfonauticus submarinus]